MTDKIDREIMQQAVQTVIQAMQYDPEYAWGWHCCIAMAFVDAGGDCYTANQGAARFLEMFAKVHPAHELPAPEPEPVAWECKAGGLRRLTQRQYEAQPDNIKRHYTRIEPEQEPLPWMRVIDEAMVVHHCGVADPADDYETAKRKLNILLYCTQDIGAYFAKQAEPEQDPVAYVLRTLSSKSISDEIAPTGWSTFESKIEKLRADPWVQNGIAEIVPLYTSPQQREWQGLTDEEIIIMSRYNLEYAALIGEVQGKLKEKNT